MSLLPKIQVKQLPNFIFNSLFSKAWLQAVVPSNLISGFRTCGVYPLNQSAIKISSNLSPDNPCHGEPLTRNLSDTNSSSHNPSNRNPSDDKSSSHNTSDGNSSSHDFISPNSSDADFTEIQECLFQKRYEECYNIFTDEDYVRWLKLYHPQFLPDEVLNDLSV